MKQFILAFLFCSFFIPIYGISNDTTNLRKSKYMIVESGAILSPFNKNKPHIIPLIGTYFHIRKQVLFTSRSSFDLGFTFRQNNNNIIMHNQTRGFQYQHSIKATDSVYTVKISSYGYTLNFLYNYNLTNKSCGNNTFLIISPNFSFNPNFVRYKAHGLLSGEKIDEKHGSFFRITQYHASVTMSLMSEFDLGEIKFFYRPSIETIFYGFYHMELAMAIGVKF